jgi:hypothetical protein
MSSSMSLNHSGSHETHLRYLEKKKTQLALEELCQLDGWTVTVIRTERNEPLHMHLPLLRSLFDVGKELKGVELLLARFRNDVLFDQG